MSNTAKTLKKPNAATINAMLESKISRDEAIEAHKALVEEFIGKYGAGTHAVQNDNGTWSRVKITDNVAELLAGNTVWRSSATERYTDKVEILKNKPRELKEVK